MSRVASTFVPPPEPGWRAIGGTHKLGTKVLTTER